MSALLPVDDALSRILDKAFPKAKQDIALNKAAGRILAADIISTRTQPPFPASAMDGYAVKSQDILRPPVRLKLVGESIAGRRFSGVLQSGEAVRIFTGAPVPDGADAVIIQENTYPIDETFVEIQETVLCGQNIRRAGLDFEQGETLLKSGRQLDPAALSLAAASNNPYLPVVGTPLVAILSTGNELAVPGSQAGPDQIISSNAYGVAALVQQAGGEVLDLGIAQDDIKSIASAIQRAKISQADVIITLGGASVGDHDLVHKTLTKEGMKADFWRIAMRPGKPLMYGLLDEIRVLGLPGNPVSSLVCSHLFVKPLVSRLAGRRFEHNTRDAILGVEMEANQKRRDYVRAIIAQTEKRQDMLVATPFPVQDSSMLKTFANADALIIREANAPAAKAGDHCKVMMLR